MKWFKHMTDADDDPVLMELDEKFPDNGLRMWWKLLQLVGTQCPPDKDDPKFGKLSITVLSFESKMQRQYKTLQKPLQLLHRRGTISFKKRNGFLHFYIKNMAKIKDNYNKKL